MVPSGVLAHVAVASMLLVACSSTTKESGRDPSPCESIRPHFFGSGEHVVVGTPEKGDPGAVLAEVRARYPKDPVKVARTLEDCVAPDGDDCRRLAAIATVFPQLMRNEHLTSAGDYVRVCNMLPAAPRRCLFPSHSLAHPAACALIDSVRPMNLDQSAATRSQLEQPSLPIIVVTRSSISIDGTDLSTIEDAARGEGVIPALIEALPKPGKESSLILQAHESTSVTLINRFVATAKQAGYHNILFAVTR